MTGRVVHFEVPYDDADRARAFYSDVFGWAIQPMPEFDYDFVQTDRPTTPACPPKRRTSAGACSSARRMWAGRSSRSTSTT